MSAATRNPRPAPSKPPRKRGGQGPKDGGPRPTTPK